MNSPFNDETKNNITTQGAHVATQEGLPRAIWREFSALKILDASMFKEIRTH
jgi:hypothetical protein